MLGLFLLGIGVVVGVYLLVRVFLSADPRTLARTVRWGGAGVVVMAVVVLVVTGRLGTALGLGAFLLPLLTQWKALRRRVRVARGPSSGQMSQVETLYLRMTLDHDSGAMAGEVLYGPFAGRSLDSLDARQILSLLEDCRRNDARSAALLEAWLDRARPDWRQNAENAGPGAGGHGSGGPMTREEAAEILGVPLQATPEQVKEAHRRLMMKVHPDHGGSNYLAAKINEAKDLLLRT